MPRRPSLLRLEGLDAERLLALIDPVLAAHSVDPVELEYKRDHRGRVLSLTVEQPGTTDLGAGVTLDRCGEISRDLSTALDVAELIGESYRLEVGSPGVERALYSRADFERFRGRTAKLKLSEPLEGQYVLRGVLRGVGEDGGVRIETDWGEHAVEPDTIEAARLVFELGSDLHEARRKRGARRNSGARRKRSASRGGR